MKTMLALAQELGVPKLKVYRCIKRFSIDTIHRNGVIYLDDTAESKVKSALEGSAPFLSDTADTVQAVSDETVNDTVLIHLLQTQLETKDAQITALMAELAEERKHSREQSAKLAQLADQAQQLQLAQITRGKPLAITTTQRPRLLDAVISRLRPQQSQKKRFDFSKRKEPFDQNES